MERPKSAIDSNSVQLRELVSAVDHTYAQRGRGRRSVVFELVYTPHEPSGLVTVSDGVVTSHHGVVSAEGH